MLNITPYGLGVGMVIAAVGFIVICMSFCCADFAGYRVISQRAALCFGEHADTAMRIYGLLLMLFGLLMILGIIPAYKFT